MNNRLKTGLVALGLTVVAVPTIGAARTHYTGKVPPSIATDTMTIAPAPRVRTVSRKTTVHTKAVKVAAHKKLTAKHTTVKKHHKHPAKKSAT